MARAHFPYFNKTVTAEISKILLEKGAAMEASASDKEIPMSAVFKAAQSFAPSPHIPISTLRKLCKFSTRTAFSSGAILAKIWPFIKMLQRIGLYFSSLQRSLKTLPVIAMEHLFAATSQG